MTLHVETFTETVRLTHVRTQEFALKMYMVDSSVFVGNYSLDGDVKFKLNWTECKTGDCKNGGFCSSDTSCSCKGGFRGIQCDTPKHIGNDSISVNKEHPSIIKIAQHKKNNDVNFNFEPVQLDFVDKQIDKLNCKKATGIDGISSKLIKLAKPTIVAPLTDLINQSFSTAVFPDQLKLAQVTPLHKKNSTLDKGNYRPVSILPVVSKLFERAINTQISDFFNVHFHAFLSAFRPGYGCQSTLLRVIEDWKRDLDENKYSNTAVIPKVRTTRYGISSFRFSAARLWNSLPQNFRDQSNYNCFRSLVSAWSGESCACSCCSAAS
ncbi:uncharacterized protein LOC127855877 [Dreissena polymorpha]|uniref:uncharacterized protein LOC127855877 n=1 Tax=Dreissena polymorpha TaxID=45954 RepID=UPI002264299F|nr:uncharacterized protein LOC127855877 [Dreissena polymorpha]